MLSLSWLPPHPDLAGALAAAKPLQGAERAAVLRALCGFRRDVMQTQRLDRLLQATPAALLNESGLRALRLAVLGSSTLDHLLPGIRTAGVMRGLNIECMLAPYGQYRQAIADEAGEVAAFQPQAVLFALDARAALPSLPLAASAEDTTAFIAERVEDLSQLWRAARARFGAIVIQQTVLNPHPSVFGSFDAIVPASPPSLVDAFNTALRAAAARERVLLVDIDRVAAQGGTEHWHDPVRWHHAKQDVSPLLAPLYGDLVARVLAAACGLSKKCAVLDLDNTLWGGVIGDDGLAGILLGQGSATGEAYIAFQRYLKNLSDRGVVLAVCSKNDPAIAAQAFDEHPEMVLKRDDIAAFVANWEDKPGNLRAIAKTLQLGLDALVFIDDNPAERDIVRQNLPMVAVPELPEDIAAYPRCIAQAGYFEAAAFTADDQARTRQYAMNARRQQELAGATDIAGFLRSLSMTMAAGRFQATDLPRIAQLVNKTNQFNLTTRRYTETELTAMAQDPDVIPLQFRLADKFGDNGLISVVIAKPQNGAGTEVMAIDTWLMSCRVLGREVEKAVLNVLVDEAAKRGARTLVGEYRRTAKNALVRDHYRRLGFAEQPPDAEHNACSRWHLDIGGFRTLPHHITVEMT